MMTKRAQSSVKDQERRIHVRKPHRTRIIFEDEFGDGLFYVYSQDISLGGIFLASDIPVRVGTMLLMSLQIPPHKRFFRVTGEVVRIANGEGSAAPGMGVRFVGLSDVARKRLEDFLAE